jgi:signal transduction histidine kinase
MTAFFSRRGAGAGARKPTVPIRVGQVYLDTRGQTLYCLNETARQLLQEGVPLGGGAVDLSSLRSLEGDPIQAADLPIVRAWRERKPQESSFLFMGRDGVPRHLTWNAAPLGIDEGVLGILSSVVVAPFEPDWQHLAGLAHDLRTPLQALRLLMPLLENTPLHSESRSILGRIRACVDRTLAISHALLEWARGPTKGGRRLQGQWFALDPFLNELAGEHAAQAEEKGIGWRTDFLPASGVEVHADRIHLGRLISNLMSNAIRYTPRGEVTIRASWRPDLVLQQALLVLSVEDTGTGISPEDQDSIFQPFERGAAGREGDSSGSGMGLTVVDQLIEELGLTLEVFSEYGRGSRFEVVLPAECVRKPQAFADKSLSEGRQPPEITPPSGG